jgi:Ca2+-binding RTX toxin-like protein
MPLSLDSFDFSTYFPAHGVGEIHRAPGGDAVVQIDGNPSPGFPRPGDDIGTGAGFMYLHPDGTLDDVVALSSWPFDFDVDRAGSIYTATWGSDASRAATRGTSRRATLGRHAPCTITGTRGDDVLHGTRGPDVICGRGGDDVIVGRGSYDVLRGGGGDDLLRGGRGIDVLAGGRGSDVLAGNARRDLLVGGGGADRLLGGPGPDTLRGGTGHDRINGGAGRDHCGDPQASTRYLSCENRR